MNFDRRIQLAANGDIVCRTLKAVGKTVTYEQFGHLIGLVPDGARWHMKYIKTITMTLALIAAIRALDGDPFDARDTVVNAQTGRPGAGVDWQPRLVLNRDR